MGLRYLLFDLDGTLIDTTALILDCYHTAVCPLVDEPPTDEEILKGFGRPLADQLNRLFPTLRDRIEETSLLWKKAQSDHHDALVKPFPGTAEVLAELKRRGYPLGVVTSKERPTAEHGLEMFGLRQFMDVLVCVDDTVNHKPHPEPVMMGIEKLGALAADTMYVGDSLFDMKAGREAGTKVAAALWGPFPKEELLAFEPDYRLATIADILTICPDVNG